MSDRTIDETPLRGSVGGLDGWMVGRQVGWLDGSSGVWMPICLPCWLTIGGWMGSPLCSSRANSPRQSLLHFNALMSVKGVVSRLRVVAQFSSLSSLASLGLFHGG